jgi:hypothetical protein
MPNQIPTLSPIPTPILFWQFYAGDATDGSPNFQYLQSTDTIIKYILHISITYCNFMLIARGAICCAKDLTIMTKDEISSNRDEAKAKKMPQRTQAAGTNSDSEIKTSAAAVVASTSELVSCGERIDTPRPLDILCGKGKPFQEHSGNLRLHQIVSLYRKSYADAPRHVKQCIVAEIVLRIKQGGSRFLRRVDVEGFWEEVSDYFAKDKVSHALRGKPSKSSSSVFQNAKHSLPRQLPGQSTTLMPTMSLNSFTPMPALRLPNQLTTPPQLLLQGLHPMNALSFLPSHPYLPPAHAVTARNLPLYPISTASQIPTGWATPALLPRTSHPLLPPSWLSSQGLGLERGLAASHVLQSYGGGTPNPQFMINASHPPPDGNHQMQSLFLLLQRQEQDTRNNPLNKYK